MAQTNRSRSRDGRGSNLTDEDRRRGGRRSAQSQARDEQGRFSGAGTRRGGR